MNFDSKNKQETVMAISLVVAVIMLSGKLTAFFITGSKAILSDAAESVVHIAATVIAAICLWYTTQPATRSYPYGYGKLAYFSAGLEGGLIFLAAIAIFFTSIESLIIGPHLEQLDRGIIIISAMATINLFLGVVLVQTGKATNSLVLIAHGQHVLSDMWTSVGVIAGVILTWYTEILWLDPIVAMCVGLYILISALSLLWQAYQGLAEKADPADTKVIIECLDSAVAKGIISRFHQLRQRRIENELWIEVHLLFPGDLTITQAHRNASTVEDSLCKAFGDRRVIVTSHLEPEEHRLAHPHGHPYQDPLDNS